MRRLLTSTACAALISLGTAGIADAHGGILTASPGPGDYVPAGIGRVDLTFRTDVLPSGVNRVEVLDPQNTNHLTGDLRVTGSTLTARLVPLEPGRHRIRYTVMASDGHEETGSYIFVVVPRPGGEDSGYGTVLYVAGGAGAALIILVMVVLLRHRSR